MNSSIRAIFNLCNETEGDDIIVTYLLKDINYFYNQEKNQYYVEITYIKDYNGATDPVDYIEPLYNGNVPSFQDIVNFFLDCAKHDFENYQNKN